MKQKIITHWHADNPWNYKIVYVPIERLAECVAGGTIYESHSDRVVPYDVPWLLAHWRSNGKTKLDAYILPQESGDSLGVRYGAEDYQYYSPHNAHPSLTKALLEEYR